MKLICKFLEITLFELDPQTTIEDESICPFCSNQLSKFQLSCNSCRNVLPFSSLTGYHLTNEDCSYCNSCYLPFTQKEFDFYLEHLENYCPACSSKLEPDTISKLNSLALVA